MRKMTASNILSSLERERIHFTSSRVQNEGHYAEADADWNYKDIPHLNQLHGQVEGILTACGDDIVTTVFLQKVGPVRVPLAVVNYSSGTNGQVYYTTIGPFCLVIDTRWVQVTPSTTSVTTEYNVGSMRALKFFHPLVHYLLKRNYDVLMSEDIPMRDRRGQLRALGYSFKNDELGYSFIDTLRTSDTNLIHPKPHISQEIEVDLRDLVDGKNIIKSLDILGLILVKSGDEISIFDRTCQHEGAALDTAQIKADCLACPWHGRLVKPLLEINLTSPGTYKTDRLDVQVSSDTVYMSLR
jgi:Rieske Fe-S protein